MATKTPVAETAQTVDATTGAHSGSDDRGIVRLSINLAPDVAGVLKRWTKVKGLSITEGVRRAIAVWDFLETARSRGTRFAFIETTADGERIREVVLMD